MMVGITTNLTCARKLRCLQTNVWRKGSKWFCSVSEEEGVGEYLLVAIWKPHRTQMRWYSLETQKQRMCAQTGRVYIYWLRDRAMVIVTHSYTMHQRQGVVVRDIYHLEKRKLMLLMWRTYNTSHTSRLQVLLQTRDNRAPLTGHY
jgi:hypothetical protein